MTYIKIPNLIFISFAIFWMFVSCDAHAWPDKFSLSYGVNEGTKRGDGNWRQDGPTVYYSRDDKDASYAFEMSGPTKWKWLRWSVGYFNRGKTSVYGAFLPDEHYKAKDFYSRDPNHIRVTASVKGFTFTLDPQWQIKKVTLYGQVGLSHYRSRTRFCYLQGDGTKFHLTGCGRNSQVLGKDTGLTHYGAVGFDWKPGKKWSYGMKWYFTGRENDTFSPSKKNRGVFLVLSRSS